MPALYALAHHDASVEASRSVLPSERLLSFLDDLYVVTARGRAADAFRTIASTIEEKAGVRSHLGKLKAWCKQGGHAPEELVRIEPTAWVADKPAASNGIIVLGAPLGTPELVAT